MSCKLRGRTHGSCAHIRSVERQIRGNHVLLAHLTDLLLHKPRASLSGRTDTLSSLTTVLNHLAARTPSVDCILITGNLTASGRINEYLLLREVLSRFPGPIFLLPGNTDSRAALRSTFSEHQYLGRGDGPIFYSVNIFPLRIISLDSLVSGKIWGRLGSDQIQWLNSQLSASPYRPTLIALHHPPFASGICSSDSPQLRDAPSLGTIIRRHPHVQCILCGHFHRYVTSRWAGTLALAAPSTAYQMTLDFSPDAPSRISAEPIGYQLIELFSEAEIIYQPIYL